VRAEAYGCIMRIAIQSNIIFTFLIAFRDVFKVCLCGFSAEPSASLFNQSTSAMRSYAGGNGNLRMALSLHVVSLHIKDQVSVLLSFEVRQCSQNLMALFTASHLPVPAPIKVLTL
jgi:hypothetical protein